MRGGESEAEIRVAAVHRARIRTCRARGGAARNAGKPPPPPSTSRERELLSPSPCAHATQRGAAFDSLYY
jgi:hypothetical protein